jgi:flagellar M-ring protein FliF
VSLLDPFRASSPRRQIAVVAVAAALVCVVLVTAYFLLIRTPYGVLFSNLRTMDAATIVAELDKKKIPYRLEAGGTTILVPAKLVDGARLGVMSEDLPLKGMVGFELFNKSDMGLTEFAQRINYQRALQGELARTIMSLDSVDTARVHLSIADPSVFRDDRRPSKASVTVLARPGREISSAAVRGIQRLVAAAVPDLSAEDVVVLDEHGATVSGEPVAPTGSPQVAQQQAVELYYSARARAVLASLYPAGASVSVTARFGPSPTSIDGQADALMAWTPGARGFPLNVSVSLPTTPSAAVEQQLRAAITTADNLDPAKGDVLVISVANPAWNSPQAAPSQARAAAPGLRPSATPASTFSLWVSAGLLLLALAAVGGLILAGRRRSPPRLTPGQRSAMAARLQALLDAEKAHAASSA